MSYLTSSERRAAAVIVLLLALGAAHDLWRARHPRPAGPPGEIGAPAGAAAIAPGDPEHARANRTGPDSAAAISPAPGLVDLNRAGTVELDALPGVGPVLAGRIVEQRRKYGPFREVDDLLAVRGIGPRLLERLRPRVTVRPAAP